MNNNALFSIVACILNGGIPNEMPSSEEEWWQLFDFAREQTIEGVVFDGIQRIFNEKGIAIPSQVLFEWIGSCESIKAQNKLINIRIVELAKLLSDNGLRGCVLKGQGNALMYPNPEVRMSGDIDVWLDADRETITKFVKNRFPQAFEWYHHIEFPIFEDVSVEVHYFPSWMANIWNNRKLQKYYEERKSEQFDNICNAIDSEGRVSVPTKSFNAIFQLSHVMNHFFDEGVGLRQIVDYYFLLKQGFTEEEKSEYVYTVNELGMSRFASSMMWVLHFALGLPSEYLLVKPEEKGGRMLLEDIVSGGNFGQYDNRYAFKADGRLRRAFAHIQRDMALASLFPSEALSMPLAKVKVQRYKLAHYFSSKTVFEYIVLNQRLKENRNYGKRIRFDRIGRVGVL